MNIDFNSLEFVTIENVGKGTPIIYINAKGITFTRGVLDYLNYASHALFMIDVKNRVFAVRACKASDSKAFKFSKPKEEQKASVVFGSKNLIDPVIKCIGEPPTKGKRYTVTGFWVAEAKTLCFDLNEVELEKWSTKEADKEQKADI